jgi:hypothetical protein
MWGLNMHIVETLVEVISTLTVVFFGIMNRYFWLPKFLAYYYVLKNISMRYVRSLVVICLFIKP